MLAGFRDIDGNKVRLADINPIRDAHRFNCSPATLAMLIDSAKAREGVGFSASQLGTTARQQLLRASDYYPTTGQMISGYFGTMKHQQVNVAREGLIVEQRFTSKRNPRLSGQIDHAAIVELTDDGTLVVDLYDLKTVKWYSVTLIKKDIWKNHPDYAWQLNLCAAMMEEAEHLTVRGYHFGDTADSNVNPLRVFYRVRVRNLYLECIPADTSYKHEAEATKLELTEFQKVLIQVDRKSADETYAKYEEALALMDKTIADGYAPVCEDRWTNKQIDNLRCRFYCDVAAECKAFSLARPEWHPLASTEELLAASLEVA